MGDSPRPRKSTPAERRGAAEGAARAVEQAIPIEGTGLGPVGEQALIGLLDEADRDEAEHRKLVRFSPRWREFIRGQDKVRLDALDEVIDDSLERKLLRRMWKRSWQIGLVVVPLVYGWATGFFSNVWPVLSRILKALQGPT